MLLIYNEKKKDANYLFAVCVFFHKFKPTTLNSSYCYFYYVGEVTVYDKTADSDQDEFSNCNYL